MGFTEIFVSTHKGALARAGELEAGSGSGAGSVRIPDISDFEIEQLGALAGAAVHASGADTELSMVDVASDSLLGVPEPMVRALAELLTFEAEDSGDDGAGSDVLADVAGKWAAEEDMPFDADQAVGYVRQLAELAASVEAAERTGLYVWSS
ncbi:hypothetical protein V1638_03815 [Pseudarthrobacter sp. J64]|uniref:hypothetical protein n=1 Tax=Pseudarthrobacter sp. J64 TaxID=3116485 RepID=UPI002E806AD0|nr:hypothetical protein [Pseudarthrobacter sp. J64]MEE2568525.1 hypothetical protein [Pseudarthrobacter sp. J64]